MSHHEEESFDPALFRRNLLKFRANLRRSLGLPRRPIRIARERLILRRLPEEEPTRAVRRVVYDSEGRPREEVSYPTGPRSLTASTSPATTETSSPGPREATPEVSHAHTPPPSVGAERIEKTRNPIQRIIEARREYGILWNIRRAIKSAVEATQREMEIERRKKELELEEYRRRLEAQRREEERRGRGLHY